MKVEFFKFDCTVTITGPSCFPLVWKFLPENALSLQAGDQPWAGLIEIQICEEKETLSETKPHIITSK